MIKTLYYKLKKMHMKHIKTASFVVLKSPEFGSPMRKLNGKLTFIFKEVH